MLRTALILVFVLSLAATATLADIVIPVVDFPIFTSKSTTLVATANPQAQLMSAGNPFWMWDIQQNEYLKDVPSGLDLCLRVFPEPEASLNGVLGVYAFKGALSKTLMNIADKKLVGLTELQKNAENRYYHDIPVDSNCSTPQAWRYGVLIQDAKRTDNCAFMVLKWATKTNDSQLAGEFRFTTSPWVGCVPKNLLPVVEKMRRAGVGGSGLSYNQIASADSLAMPPTPPPPSKDPVTFRVCIVDEMNKPVTCYPTINVWIIPQGGDRSTGGKQPDAIATSGGETTLCRVPGCYEVKFDIPGVGDSDWWLINVFPNMGPVKSKIHVGGAQ